MAAMTHPYSGAEVDVHESQVDRFKADGWTVKAAKPKPAPATEVKKPAATASK